MASADDDAIDALFAVPPSGFVAARDRLAADLKKAGKKAEAASVKAIARPVASVWAVNQLTRHAGHELAGFLTATAELREAQAAGTHSERGREAYKNAVAAQREALDRLLERAAAALAGAALGGNRSLLDKVANNLRWGAIGEETRSLIARGRLGKDVAPPDFAVLVEQIPLRADGARSPAGAPEPAGPPVASEPGGLRPTVSIVGGLEGRVGSPTLPSRSGGRRAAPLALVPPSPAGAERGRAPPAPPPGAPASARKQEEAEARAQEQARLRARERARTLREELRSAERETRRARDEVERARGAHARAEQKVADARATAARVERELAAAAAELAGTEQTLAAREERVAGLTRDLDALDT